MTRKEDNLKLCSDMTATDLEQFFAENVLEDLLCPVGTGWKSVAEPPLRKELLEADPCTRIASEIEVSISKPAQWLNTKTRGKSKLKANSSLALAYLEVRKTGFGDKESKMESIFLRTRYLTDN